MLGEKKTLWKNSLHCRWVVLCKDAQGKVGLRVTTYRKGVFVVLVVPGSPAAMAGLRFGDQLLTLGRTELAGRTADSVHCLLRETFRNIEAVTFLR